MKRLHSLGVALTFAAACASVWGQVPVAQAWALTEAQTSRETEQAKRVAAQAAASTKTQDGSSKDESEDGEQPSFPENIDDLLAAGEYAEGEAMATVSPDIDAPEQEPSAPGDITYEKILTTTGDIYEDALDQSVPEKALLGARDDSETVSAGDVEIETFLIKAEGMSTRDLLELLAKDPRVLDASPNYIHGLGEDELSGDSGDGDEAEGDGGNGAAGDEAGAGSGETAALSVSSENQLLASSNAYAGKESFVPAAATDVTASADATQLQWAYSSDRANTFGGQRSLTAVLGSYNWNTATPNASGVVAVFDTGVDYSHPDLAASMFDMSPYVSKVGGTSHGYNAVNESAEPLDDQGHGTHVAGIVAAATNGFGVSGAANGAKLLAVKAGDSGGRFSSSDIQRGYAYLKSAVEAGVDLRVVNNSWNGTESDQSVLLAVTDLGALGVVSVFAAGNAGKNIDGTTNTASTISSNVYTLSVGSLDMDGKISTFSNYGLKSVDFFTPGSSIMSTTRSDTAGAYLPAAMRDSSSTYVSFSGASDTLTATTNAGVALGKLSDAGSFDEQGGCLELTGEELNKTHASVAGSNVAKRIVLQVPVDESKLDEASMVGCAINFKGRASTTAWLEVMGEKGWISGESDEKTVADTGNWTTLSIDLSNACSVHNGRAVLLHDASGKAYIKVSICLTAKNLKKATSGLKIDCVGIGSTSWHYGFKSGTSMAAPLVSGLVAVLESEMPDFNTLYRTVRAAKAVGLMTKSVDKREGFEKKCWSGGVVDPAGFASAIAADKQSFVGDMAVEDDPDGKTYVLTVTGAGFGKPEESNILFLLDAGECKYEVLSWSDTKIVLRVEKTSGVSNVTVTVDKAGAGGGASSASTSVLGGDDDPDEPDNPTGPTDPAKPSGPSGSADSGGSAPSGAAGSSGSSAQAGRAVSGSAVDKRAGARINGLADTGDRTIALVGALVLGGAVALVAGIVVARKRR